MARSIANKKNRLDASIVKKIKSLGLRLKSGYVTAKLKTGRRKSR
jgi:hypothetical protein